MTEFLPTDALLAQNEEKTMDLRINAWSHREHVKPILVRMFTAAAIHAFELRAQKIDEINAIGIKKFYYEHATLNDDSSVKLSDLLEFPLYSTELPVEQAGLPEDQQFIREYSVTLRVGGPQLMFGTDDELDLWLRYAGGYGNDGDYVGKRAYESVLQKNATPETVRIIEKVETGLGSLDDLHNRYRDRQAYVTSIDNYYLKTQTWIPNLAHFGQPDVTLPKITDISFNYNTSYDNQKGHIDKYGGMSDDKIACARKLARLTELASRFLNLESVAVDEEMEPLRAIAAAEQRAL